MEKMIYDLDRYRHTIKNWWVMVLLGVVIFIVGIVVMRHPGESYAALAYTFAFVVIASGIMQLYLAYYTAPNGGRGWLIAGGIIEVVLGILLIATPVALLSILPFILGFWLLFRSIALIGVASDMMAYKIKGAGWIVALSIILMIFAFIVIFYPIIGVGALVVWLSLSFLMAGISMMVFGFYLMKLRRSLTK